MATPQHSTTNGLICHGGNSADTFILTITELLLLTIKLYYMVNNMNKLLSCLVGILANTPGGVKRSGLGAHAVWLLVVY